jgi:hypothetical protein
VSFAFLKGQPIPVSEVKKNLINSLQRERPLNVPTIFHADLPTKPAPPPDQLLLKL